MKTEFTTGAGIDYRTADQKAQDFRPQEAFASVGVPVEWKPKSIDEMEKNIKATSISQGQTSRCVSEYAGIALEMAEFAETGKRVVFSRRDVYCRRANRPAEGMSMPDLFKIMRDGTCLESQLPSTATKESVINEAYTVTDEMLKARKQYSAGTSFTWDTFTINDIALQIQNGTPVCLFWYFDNTSREEWWNTNPKVVNTKIDLYTPSTGRHQCTAIDFCTVNGVKHLLVMDSAGQGTGLGKQGNLRLVSESFFKARCYGAGFTIDQKDLDFKPEPVIRYTFTKNLRNGMEDADVQVLQKILVLEGCLAIKTPTRYYGGMTQNAVAKLQEKYADEILKPLGLTRGTGLFLDATRAFINKKYGA